MASCLEEIGKICIDRQGERKREFDHSVVLHTDALVTSALPEKASPTDVKRPACHRPFPVEREVRVGDIDREQRIVFLHGRTEQHGFVQTKRQLKSREKPRPFVIEPLRTRQHFVNVAISIEYGECFALLQHLRAIIRQCG